MRQSKARNADVLLGMRQRLNTLLKERGLLPAELAAMAIVPLSTLTRILAGEVQNPGVDNVVSFAKALKVPTSELIGDLPTAATKHVTIVTTGPDQIGILRDITQIFADEDISIAACFATAVDGDASVVTIIPLPSPEQWRRIKRRMAESQTIDKMRTSVKSNGESNIRSAIEDYLKTDKKSRSRRGNSGTPSDEPLST